LAGFEGLEGVNNHPPTRRRTMGAILDDLDGHEGYPLRQLLDGTTT
jgi:hypothetical protein